MYIYIYIYIYLFMYIHIYLFISSVSAGLRGQHVLLAEKVRRDGLPRATL